MPVAKSGLLRQVPFLHNYFQIYGIISYFSKSLTATAFLFRRKDFLNVKPEIYG